MLFCYITVPKLALAYIFGKDKLHCPHARARPCIENPLPKVSGIMANYQSHNLLED